MRTAEDIARLAVHRGDLLNQGAACLGQKERHCRDDCLDHCQGLAGAIRTALSEAYAEGRAAGVEEAAKWHDEQASRQAEYRDRAGDHFAVALAEDTTRFDHEQHAKGIRSLIPSPVTDKETT